MSSDHSHDHDHGHGHDHVKEQLQLEQTSGKISREIVATFAGGVLLICSFLAQLLWTGQAYVDPATGEEVVNNFYADMLGLVAAILLGAPLIKVAIKDLIKGHMHMNELVALAIVAAMAIGSYQEAAAIAFFMIISVLIETRTAVDAKKSIESLIRITPTKAHLLQDGQETEVEAKDLKPGDVVVVRPGDNIPADGEVADGLSTVNQANITGESLPVDKNIGDEVFGGTINVTGRMEIRVTKAGEDTTLGRVKDLILQAETSSTPIMRMIDRYAGWYTPTVLMLVGVMLFFTLQNNAEQAVKNAITMLVVACPCALILATPTAMVAGLSAAARLGVLVKSVSDLEAARNMTAMVFDKTGTLTTGELAVSRLTPTEGVEGADLLQAAAAVEANSRHPVARAVTNVARQANLHLGEVEGFEEVPGKGVRGKVDGHEILVGRGSWLSDDGAGNLDDQTNQTIQTALDSPEAEGLSLLFVVRDGKLLGWVGLADNARAGAASAVDNLRELGLKRLVIVTGDRESVAKRVAAQMHTEYKAEVLPEQKLQMVDDLKSRGHRVAVVGDGVNDAPALKAGDVSIAMGAAGSDVAIHSANIALMNNNLNRIPFLISLSRKTTNVIRQNLVFGFAFVIIFMAFGAAGQIEPITAAILHVVSGLIVIFNSARLVRSGEDIEHAEAEALSKQKGASSHSHDHGSPAPAVA